LAKQGGARATSHGHETQLPANGHTAFTFSTLAAYIHTLGKRGVLRLFVSPNGLDAPTPFNGPNGLLLEFLPNLNSTSVQAVHQ
jgi:hypothetical protein